MGDTITYSQTNDGFKSVIDFEPYLQQRRQELLGMKHEMVQAKRLRAVVQEDGTTAMVEEVIKEQLPDGSWQEVWIERTTEASEASRLVNQEGADYIIRNLRKFFNKHSSMGHLVTNEECAKLAAPAVQSIYAHVEAHMQIYGVTEEKFSALEGEFDTDMRSVYLLLTSFRDHGLRAFGEGTQKATYTGSSDAGGEPQRKGLLGT